MIDMQTSIKPLSFGFLTGVALVFVSFFGLVVALIEFLRPVLIPGVDSLQVLPEGVRQSNFIGLLIAGALLNGIIYAALFLVISLAKRNINHQGVRVIAVALVILVFLAATGMLGSFLDFLASPNKSWIFGVGA